MTKSTKTIMPPSLQQNHLHKRPSSLYPGPANVVLSGVPSPLTDAAPKYLVGVEGR